MDATCAVTNNPPLTFHLAVDGGGSSCVAALVSSSGTTSTGEAGPCNISTIGICASLAVISTAVESALAAHPEWPAQAGEAVISSAWVALAGYDRPSLVPRINTAISELLKLPLGPSLTITTDIDLMLVGPALQPRVESAIVLVVGTGSIAMCFKRDKDGQFSRTARMGGWGPLLGDDGSGFAIGKEALRMALRASDRLRAGDDGKDANHAISDAVFSHFRELDAALDTNDLLSAVLNPTEGASSPTKRIAEVAKVVFSLAAAGNDDARELLRRQSLSVVELVSDLLKYQTIKTDTTAFVFAGGLSRNALYNKMLREELTQRGIEFGWVMDVKVPAVEGAHWLARKGSKTPNTLW